MTDGTERVNITEGQEQAEQEKPGTNERGSVPAVPGAPNDTAPPGDNPVPSSQKKQHSYLQQIVALWNAAPPEDKLTTLVASVGTLVAFVGTLAAIFVGVITLLIMDRQTEIMGEQSKLINLGNQTSQAVQRAIIRHSHFNLDFETLNGTRLLSFREVWENSGVTEAVDIIQRVRFEEFKGEPTLEQFVGGSHKGMSGVVGPHGQLFSSPIRIPEFKMFGFETPDATAAKIAAIKHRELFFYGWIAYRDVFPNSKPHVTGFCQKLNAIKFVGTEPGFEWVNCGKYNCVDRRCEGYEEIVKFLPK